MALTAYLLTVVAIAGVDPQAPQVEITAILHTGDPAPGIPGATIVFMFTPHIDGAGNVLIKAQYQNAGEPFVRIIDDKRKTLSQQHAMLRDIRVDWTGHLFETKWETWMIDRRIVPCTHRKY